VLAVERAFDTLSDYVHGVEDEDQRATVIERIVAALAKLLESAASEQRYVVLMDLAKRLGFPPPRQLSRAQAEQTKSRRRKRATSETTALVWKDLGNHSIAHAWSAAGGHYKVTPIDTTSGFGGYHVQHIENPTALSQDQKRHTLKQGVKTAEAAKAIAQRDYDERIARG
jgi:hypothetical protein